jgi:hypothetical protein
MTIEQLTDLPKIPTDFSDHSVTERIAFQLILRGRRTYYDKNGFLGYGIGEEYLPTKSEEDQLEEWVSSMVEQNPDVSAIIVEYLERLPL